MNAMQNVCRSPAFLVLPRCVEATSPPSMARFWTVMARLLLMTLAAGTKLGPYEDLPPLGAGGMGEVWRARDPRLAREVAIKVGVLQIGLFIVTPDGGTSVSSYRRLLDDLYAVPTLR